MTTPPSHFPFIIIRVVELILFQLIRLSLLISNELQLNQVDYHLVVSSTALMTGIHFGMPSIQLIINLLSSLLSFDYHYQVIVQLRVIVFELSDVGTF